MNIKHQVDINATETFKEKITFEREDQSQGVMIKGYHTDNWIFNASEFMGNILKNQQKIRFSGAGASHQNGAAERSIKTVVTMVRTMLMHAALRCLLKCRCVCKCGLKVGRVYVGRFMVW